MTITRPRIPHSDNFEDDPTKELQGSEGHYHAVVSLRLPYYGRPAKMENMVADLLHDIHIKNNEKASVDSWHWEASTRNYPFDDPDEQERTDGGSTPQENDSPQEGSPEEPSEDSCNDRASETPD